MKKHHETVLVSVLAGLIIASAAAFAVTPANAAGYPVDQLAQVDNIAHWDRLNVRKWPASYSQRVGALQPNTHVWVERCNIIPGGADWCLVERGNLRGWVNSNYLTIVDEGDI